MPYKDKEKQKQYVRERKKELLRRFREERGNKCENEGCDSTFDLEFAHLEPTGLKGKGRGMSNRAYDIKKHPQSYKLLCGPCHDELDGRTVKGEFVDGAGDDTEAC